MKDNKKKELIEEIIGQLKDHELPYKEGSREKFGLKLWRFSTSLL
jgi:hypothetical protein